MFRLAKNVLKFSNLSIPIKTSYQGVRKYLSETYQSYEKWDEAISTDIIQKTNINELLIDIDDKLTRKKYVSSLDIEILAAKLANVETTDDLKMTETILEKFRYTPEALEFQPSLTYCLVRNYLDLGQKERMIPLLQDKLKYGLYLDRFSANLILNAFLIDKKYKEATLIATEIALQEDDDDHLTRALALCGCYNYYLTATDDDLKTVIVEEEDEDIVKIKVPYVRNLINDDHFDLTDKKKLLGKTMAYMARYADTSGIASLKVIGLALYQKFDRAHDVLEEILNNPKLQLDESALQVLEKEIDSYEYNEVEDILRLPQSPYRPLELIPEAAGEKIKKFLIPKLQSANQIVNLDLKNYVETYLKEQSLEADKTDVLKHERQIFIWTNERQEQLNDQIYRFLIEKQKQNLFERIALLEERDELLNFFDNESQIVMASVEKDFENEQFENIKAPKEHEYFESARLHYHWDKHEPKRSLHPNKKVRDEEMSDNRNWPSYPYYAENWKYDLTDYVPLAEKHKRRHKALPPTGKPPYYKQYFF